MEKRKAKNNKVIAWSVLIIALAATIIAENFIHVHVVFGLEGRMFFHAWYGLIMCAAIVIFSKFLGFFVKRKESYYKENRND